MIMEIIVGTIALAFVILVVFLILTLQEARKTMKSTSRALFDIHLLTLDLKKKSEGLDHLFTPLYRLSEEKKSDDTLSSIVGFVAEGVRLFQKLKDR